MGGFIPLLFLAFRNDCKVSLRGVALLIAFGFKVRLLMSLTSVKFISEVNCHTSVVLTRAVTTTNLVLLAMLPRYLKSPFIKLLVTIVVCTVKNKLLRILMDPIIRTYPASGGRGTVDLLRSFCY